MTIDDCGLNASLVAIIALSTMTCRAALSADVGRADSSPYGITLPKLFSDGMVLQRDMPVPVWGLADPGEKVTVKVAGQEASAVADDKRQWLVKLPAMQAGGPFEMTVSGKNTLVVKDVLVGEVWICAGQSNMEKPIGPHPGQKPCPNWEQEIAGANFPEMRLLEVPPKGAPKPVTDVSVQWLVCTPANIRIKRGGGHGYSAAAYFFGRELHKELRVPVGLIAASASGTRCEPWTPHGEGVPPNNRPDLFNGIINPLIPFAMRGVIWYQGESNMGDGMKYCDRMKALIAGWRKAWGQGDFPFYFVQLPPADYGADPLKLPELREAQAATLVLPNTGMAVTIDIGSYPDCHAPNKQDVGKRLALSGLAKVYGRGNLVYSGPLYKSMSVEGGKVRIRFDHIGGGLAARDGNAKELTWFEMAGADRKFVKAGAQIDGETVLVSNDAVAQPAAVRFGWHQQAVPNLMNKEGLPAAPFRTDDWPR